MTLSVFDVFLRSAEAAMALSGDFPDGLDATELESAFVSLGVVLLHSHMEQCVREAVHARCARCTDEEVRGFARSITDERSGRISISALNQTLSRFCSAYKESFINSLQAAGLNAAWDSIVNHRKIVAHEGQPASLTLRDLRGYFDGVCQVLGLYCHALELNADEASRISPLIQLPSLNE